MTQVVKSLVQCNKCNSAGHPNQMIGFVKTDKKKSDGRPFWDLVNADMSPHTHKTTVVLPDIEEPQPQPQPPLTISHKGGNEITPTETTQKSQLVVDIDSLSFTQAEIRILKELAGAISELIKVRK